MSKNCTNKKLREFSLEHFTFINQIFGDETVREDIQETWPNKKYKLQIEHASSDFADEDDSMHHVIEILDKKGESTGKWCSVDGCDAPDDKSEYCYQNPGGYDEEGNEIPLEEGQDRNNILCQSYTLLKYFNKLLTPKETDFLHYDEKIQVQKDMVKMYKTIIRNRSFLEKFETLDHEASWTDYRVDPSGGNMLNMDFEEIVANINRVLNIWKDYGHHWFIGEGTCPKKPRATKRKSAKKTKKGKEEPESTDKKPVTRRSKRLEKLRQTKKSSSRSRSRSRSRTPTPTPPPPSSSSSPRRKSSPRSKSSSPTRKRTSPRRSKRLEKLRQTKKIERV